MRDSGSSFTWRAARLKVGYLAIYLSTGTFNVTLLKISLIHCLRFEGNQQKVDSIPFRRVYTTQGHSSLVLRGTARIRRQVDVHVAASPPRRRGAAEPDPEGLGEGRGGLLIQLGRIHSLPSAPSASPGARHTGEKVPGGRTARG